MNSSYDVNWDSSIWKMINEAVVSEMGKVRTAQKVFPTKVYDTNPTEIPNDVINFPEISITEGQTKPLIELYQEFFLTVTQVNKEPTTMTCQTLARMVAKALALSEDAILFQGKQAKLPPNMKADSIDSAGNGLLGAATGTCQ